MGQPLAARAALALAALLAVAGCARGAGDGPAPVTDRATKAVYDDDLNALQAQFDDDLRRQITLDQVATMSSRFKALGAYKGLTDGGADEARKRYDYTANFDNGTVAVHVRFDDTGKLAAYRVDVPVIASP